MTSSKAKSVQTIEQPPVSILGILRRLGPGLIIAGSIVGSGELIATTATGAQAGYWLLWLILIGCVIKVFVQVELGRYTISTGQAAMVAMNEAPGPVIEVAANGGTKASRVRANWLAWYWLVMFLVSLGQLGGIVGGVGQAMAISIPLTAAGRAYNDVAEARSKAVFALHQKRYALESAAPDEAATLKTEIATLETQIEEDERKLKGEKGQPGLEVQARDHQLWATIITIATAVLLVAGRYGFIQWAATFMVASFTLVTVVNVVMLQTQPEWAVGWNDLVTGLSFRLPAKYTDASGSTFFPLTTALMTFGIIGVGANELISYPYWCVEKGYARFAGPRDESEGWAQRANGWLRVMRWDAWCSAVVYTFATVAFYLLGAATLGRLHLTPKGFDMIRTLSVMYEPVFGGWTKPLFLFGAFAVLYSTFFVALAGHARVCADALRVFGRQQSKGEISQRAVAVFSGGFPFLCLLIYWVYPEPTTLVLASGAMQAMMLPMLSFAALYFRYRKTDRRIAPSKLWDLCLWVSAIGMLLAGGWLFLTTLFPALKSLA